MRPFFVPCLYWAHLSLAHTDQEVAHSFFFFFRYKFHAELCTECFLYINYILLNFKAAFQTKYGNLRLIYEETDSQVKSLLLFAKKNKSKVERKFSFWVLSNYKIDPLAFSQWLPFYSSILYINASTKHLKQIYARKQNVFVYKTKK